MAILESIENILASDLLDDEANADSKCEQIERLIAVVGWNTVRDSVLEVLAADRPAHDYRIAAEVLWGAVLDGRDLPIDRVIALLYYRSDPCGSTEDNLAWSITSKLKGVGYLSEYQPLQDPGVKAQLDAIRAG